MKIISVDNYDRELIGTSDDKLVAENIKNGRFAEIMVKALNEKNMNDRRYFRTVDDDYQLKEYRP